ncbi:transcription-repair coupling factor [candidate division KSB1 bacterium]|nr:transcription-repair coupling factor [candidate division KSB1 bacterium]
MFKQFSRPVLYIVPEEEQAEILSDDLKVILGDQSISYLPDQKDRPYETIIIDSYRKSVYLDAIKTIASGTSSVVVITAAALSKKIISHHHFIKNVITVTKGQDVDFDDFKTRLASLGFERENFVDDCGEMSVRGGIIDVFPYSVENPVRIEFFGNRIESIREFSLATQRSIKEIPSITIYPQFPEDQDQNTDTIYESLIDYLTDNTIVFLEDLPMVNKILDEHYDEAQYQYDVRRAKVNEIKSPEQLYITSQALDEELRRFKRIHVNSLIRSSKNSIDIRSMPQEKIGGNFKILKDYMDNLYRLNQNRNADRHFNIHFLCDSENQLERIESIMVDNGIDVHRMNFAVSLLNQGFVLPELKLAVLTDNQFYGRSGRRIVRRRVFQGLSTRQFNSLNSGDYVVHVDHGIGKYIGLKKISVNKAERECITIQYQDNDLLYVPLEKMDRIQKYASREGMLPQINKLGTGEWEKLKNRTKKKVKDIARELILLYAKRNSEVGYAFSKDGPWQRELEATFSFDDTTDQLRATEEIKQDMENPRPMDRLVCGDVGYGKTEVALRAAFKAINDSKQVAVLVPTTILALQHYNTFTERMKNFPVKIEMLSRFRSRIEQQKVIEWIKAGKVDIIIGTHRLLSKDVQFKDLGLLIIDEEQRFGVRHKEKIKSMSVHIDVLTMSATPIPRTLNMALMGVRDMSIINTPPQGRLPIYTEVIPFEKHTIRAAILKEYERGGQIFFVHNRVQSIYAMTDLLKRLVPEVTFAVAHGQMESSRLERVMWEFAHKHYDCLIATMIIESGLDIPNVNTLIINRADRFGLAQLYQLRGRVGRSDNRAYAYLITPAVKYLTRDAMKRLRALEEYTELGSGFNISMRDLQIRGAGNILGGEQSGFIVSLGYELYHKILEEAVQEIKSEMSGEILPAAADAIEAQIEAAFDAYLPEHYISQAEERVSFYKRLVEIKDVHDLDEISHEMIDRFGTMPEQAKNLINSIHIKILSEHLKINRVSIHRHEVKAQFHDSFLNEGQELQHQKLVSMVDKSAFPFTYYFTRSNQLGIKLTFDSLLVADANAIELTKKFLQSII